MPVTLYLSQWRPIVHCRDCGGTCVAGQSLIWGTHVRIELTCVLPSQRGNWQALRKASTKTHQEKKHSHRGQKIRLKLTVASHATNLTG
jgi:hypothetical protein